MKDQEVDWSEVFNAVDEEIAITDNVCNASHDNNTYVNEGLIIADGSLTCSDRLVLKKGESRYEV